MSENLFRIGGVYRTQGGFIFKLAHAVNVPHWERERPGHRFAQAQVVSHIVDGQSRPVGDAAGYTSIEDGRYVGAWPSAESAYHLIPGELEPRDGQWVPITEQPMAPYFAEAVEEKADFDAAIDEFNAAMIARDGPTRPAAVIAPAPTPSTTKPAIAGLSRLAGGDHRLGGHAFHSF